MTVKVEGGVRSIAFPLICGGVFRGPKTLEQVYSLHSGEDFCCCCCFR
jgi:hypothetical protein